ncbi:MAG: DUF2058 domain-containing protein [Desulfobulbaceae bacterium]|nr:DUF2058 domain-containing protein [Desulfobulbaceae bacterium]
MGNSLTDQLLKTGLANKKQLNKAKQEQQQSKKKQQGKGKNAAPEVSEVTRAAQKAKAEEAERNRLLNQQQQEQKKHKELDAQISQLIESNELMLEKGGSAYNFVDDNKIKKIYVSKAIREQLSRGTVAIVRHREKYHVVGGETADKISQRDASTVIFKNEPKKKVEGEYDPYEEFPVPDDIDW